MFAERLNLVLQDNEIKQVYLANELGLTQQAINRWCRGITQPDHSTLVKIANILDVSVDYLLGNDKRSTKVEEAIKEKETLKKVLIEAGYMNKDEDLSKEELERLMKFVKNNKEFIKNNK